MSNIELDKIFFSLANTNRRLILSLLVAQDLSVGLISRKSKMSIALASKHLQVLVKCELVTAVKNGRNKIYKLNLSKFSKANVWIGSLGLLDSLDTSRLENFLSSENLL